MKPIRNSAKAVIMQDGRVLLTRNIDHEGIFYLFPGGGQEKGETLKDALVRECLEEIGAEVEVGDLLFIREYIGKNHKFAEWDADVHQIEFYFACRLKTSPASSEPGGTRPDERQIGVEWMDVSKLDEIVLYPQLLGTMLKEGRFRPCYIGDTI